MTQTKRVTLVGGPLDGQTRVVNAERREIDLADPVNVCECATIGRSTLPIIERRFSTYQYRTDGMWYFVG